MQIIRVLPRLQGSNRELYKTFIALIFWMLLLLSIAYNPWFIEIVINRLALGLSYFISLILQSSGNEIERIGTVIRCGGFSMDIYYKCTGVYQAAGFVAGVFAYPTPLRNKVAGVVCGVGCISVINVVRIVSIFYTGLHLPKFLPVFHGIIWETLMILLTIWLWLMWAKRSSGATSTVMGLLKLSKKFPSCHYEERSDEVISRFCA
ncbi:MAG: hypothetical protein ACE5IW_01765 [bacterium]